MRVCAYQRLAVACCLMLWGAVARAQQFVIEPASADVVQGQALRITLTGVPPNREVTISARRELSDDEGGRRVYRSEARFLSAADGTIDLATQAPVSGGYRHADLRGLFWSMQPVGKSEQAASDATANAEAEAQVMLEARSGDQVWAQRTLRLRAAAPTLRWRDASPFPGARMAWPDALHQGPWPAIVALGGSEGDDAILRRAALLASHGFVVLGLPYYSPPRRAADGTVQSRFPALPAAFADIPVDRLEAARAWLAAQPEVDANRIGLYGISKGAEFVLIAASRMRWPKSVVAIAPSDVVWEGWGVGVEPGQRASFSWQGKPLPFVPYVDFGKEFDGFRTGEPILIRRPHDKGRAAHAQRVSAARIAVEAYAGPLLVIGGRDDQIWDSGGMAQHIATQRAKAGRETVALIYRDAGHALAGTGWNPTTQYNVDPIKSGGAPPADAAAQADAFIKTLEFLRRTLGPPSR